MLLEFKKTCNNKKKKKKSHITDIEKHFVFEIENDEHIHFGSFAMLRVLALFKTQTNFNVF